ncbi:hypothetical protein BRADI_1g50525v3 [Brachypodium distachyon]|uniref:Uncharacterized protein n=1 Tax=Brachypodium distachyon TaxID=15368 RepID=A0A0Q3NQL4_BRADI|nr:hypothetical protein BRADI_1g50525v3 [Brachypodium distachyon]
MDMDANSSSPVSVGDSSNLVSIIIPPESSKDEILVITGKIIEKIIVFVGDVGLIRTILSSLELFLLGSNLTSTEGLLPINLRRQRDKLLPVEVVLVVGRHWQHLVNRRCPPL